MRVRDQAVNEPGRITSPLATAYDRDTVGRRSERVARFLGTGRYLAIQTLVVIAWIALNVTLAATDRWDKYPFILLNLVFSTQAAYAAPLILLAQNRQDARDRALAERDREISNRVLEDTGFLSRELAGIRLRLDHVAGSDDLEDLREAVDKLVDRA
jgi:uncharacterized membrane protein